MGGNRVSLTRSDNALYLSYSDGALSGKMTVQSFDLAPVVSSINRHTGADAVNKATSDVFDITFSAAVQGCPPPPSRCREPAPPRAP